MNPSPTTPAQAPMTDLLKRLGAVADKSECSAANLDADTLPGEPFEELYRGIAADQRQDALTIREACRIIKEQREALGVAREAFGPFAGLAEEFVDSHGWGDGKMSERVADWFEPSDFRQAAAAHQLLTDLPGDES